MSTKRRRAGLLDYLELVVGVVLLTGISFVFTKLFDSVYGNKLSVSGTETVLIIALLFLFFFAIYLWVIDRRGVIARMLGAGNDRNVTRIGNNPSVLFSQSVSRGPRSQRPLAVNFEKEKVSMYWDFKRGTLFALLGFYVSGFLAIVFNADKFASGPWLVAVIVVPAVVLVVLGLYVWRSLELLAVQVSRYMTKVEGGASLGRFDQMLGLPSLPEIVKGAEPLKQEEIDRLRAKVITVEPQPRPSPLPKIRANLERLDETVNQEVERAVRQTGFSSLNSIRALVRSLPSMEELTLDSVERFNNSTLFLNIRNPGQKEVRINRYSVNKGEPIGRAPPLVIHPGSVERLKVSQDLASKTPFESGKTYEVTVWTERGWSFTFSFEGPD